MIPYIRKNYTPDKKGWHNETTISISDFSGGMNNYIDDSAIADNESPDTMNMVFAGNGLMKKRYGLKPFLSHYSQYGFYPMSDISLIRLFRYGLGQLLSVCISKYGDNYYYYEQGVQLGVVNDFNIKKFIPLVFNNTYALVKNGLYYVGGLISDGHRVLSTPIGSSENGGSLTTVAHVGSPQPSSNITFSTSTKMHYKNYLGSERLNFDSFSIITTDGVILWFSPTYNNYTVEFSDNLYHYTLSKESVHCIGVDGIRIPEESKTYSWNGDTSVYFYSLKGANHISGDMVTLERDFDVSDSGGQYYAPCLNELKDPFGGLSFVPEDISSVEVHKERVFISSGNLIFCSTPNNPNYFPANASMQLPLNNHPIIDMVSFDGSLVIGREYDMYLLSGSSVYENDNASDYFTLKKIDTSVGFKCRDCGGILNNFYIFLGSDKKFYKLSSPKTTDADYVMTKPLTNKIDLNLPPFSIPDNLDYMNTVVCSGQIFFHFSRDLTIVYDYDTMSFSYITGWNNKCLVTFENKLYMDCENGIVCYDYNDSDDSSYSDIVRYVFPSSGCDVSEVTTDVKPIECHLYSKKFNFGSSVNYKYLKQLLISSKIFRFSDGNGNEVVKPTCFSLSLVSDTEEIEDFYLQYEASDGGSDGGIDDEYYSSHWLPIDIKTRMLQLKFKDDTLHSPMMLYNVNFIVTSRDVR